MTPEEIAKLPYRPCVGLMLMTSYLARKRGFPVASERASWGERGHAAKPPVDKKPSKESVKVEVRDDESGAVARTRKKVAFTSSFACSTVTVQQPLTSS